ncbi:GNAT family N-acetyltransferase [Allohahella marinimesophila]|uniref:GNAT family N-acetyltransferase n=1 Tax=Allohahella marinimesophila TaxID=1054972 RepID=A0ABP7NUE2_9GAMM
MSSPIHVRSARADDIDLVVDILADAFKDDPVLLWISSHADFPVFNFKAVIQAFIDDRGILVDDSGSAAALFLPPGKTMSSVITAGVALKGLWTFGPGALLKAVKLLDLFEQHHYQGDHIYIFAIGNRATARQQGFGSAVMKHLLSLAGADRYPVYLENSKPANAQFYAKFGFEPVVEIALPRGGPPVTSMLRKAPTV